MIMDCMEYKIAIMGLLVGTDSHYEKKSVNAMNTAHSNIRNEVETIGVILSTARNEAGDVIKKILPKNSGPAKFYGMPKIHKATETNLPFRPILFPALAFLPAG